MHVVIFKISIVNNSIVPSLRSVLAVLHPVFPCTIVICSLTVPHFSLSMSKSVEELSLVSDSFFCLFSLSMRFAILPLSNIRAAVGINSSSLAVSFSVQPLSVIFRTVREENPEIRDFFVVSSEIYL